MNFLKICSILLVSVCANSAYACKLSPIGASKLEISAALNAYTAMFASSDNIAIKKISIDDKGFIEIKSILNGMNLKTLYKVGINADCSTTVYQVKE